jgi:hypothetical protein
MGTHRAVTLEREAEVPVRRSVVRLDHERHGCEIRMKLKIGDRIRIIGIPKGQMFKETREVFRKLAARKQPLRICEIDEYGQPWYRCRLRILRSPGQANRCKWEEHSLAIMEGDDNWIKVKPRKAKN